MKCLITFAAVVFFVSVPPAARADSMAGFTITYGSNVATFTLPSSPIPTGTNAECLSNFQPESVFERGNGRGGRGGLICYRYEIRGEIPHRPPKNARWSHLRSSVAVRLALL